MIWLVAVRQDEPELAEEFGSQSVAVKGGAWGFCWSPSCCVFGVFDGRILKSGAAGAGSFGDSGAGVVDSGVSNKSGICLIASAPDSSMFSHQAGFSSRDSTRGEAVEWFARTTNAIMKRMKIFIAVSIPSSMETIQYSFRTHWTKRWRHLKSPPLASSDSYTKYESHSKIQEQGIFIHSSPNVMNCSCSDQRLKQPTLLACYPFPRASN